MRRVQRRCHQLQQVQRASLVRACDRVVVVGRCAYRAVCVCFRHFVDDNSWPVVFPNYPNFAEKGAYDVDAVYQPADIATVVQYAWERGIMVIPGRVPPPRHTHSCACGTCAPLHAQSTTRPRTRPFGAWRTRTSPSRAALAKRC